MGKKSKKASGSGSIAAILAAIVDVLLVALLVVAFLIEPVEGGSGKVNLPGDFEENAENYGQIDNSAEYASEAEVSYKSSSAAKAASEENEDNSEETEDSKYAGFVFPDSDTTALTDSRIRETVKDYATCRRAINEIYARHGYAFTKQENIDYFNTYDWYKNMEKESDMTKVSRKFNSTEKSNVEKLQAYEDSKNWN